MYKQIVFYVSSTENTQTPASGNIHWTLWKYTASVSTGHYRHCTVNNIQGTLENVFCRLISDCASIVSGQYMKCPIYFVKLYIFHSGIWKAVYIDYPI